MKWNGRPDPGERTRRRVHRNEGHPLPGDAGVSGDGPGQARPGGSPTNPPNPPNPSQRLHVGLHAVDRRGRSSRVEVTSESSVCLRRLLLKCRQLPEQMATRCVLPYLFHLF